MNVDPQTSAQVITPGMWGPELPVLTGPGSCREIIGARTGARLRSLYRIDLADGSGTGCWEHGSEAVYYVLGGTVQVATAGDTGDLGPGGMVHVPPSTRYSIRATEDAVVLGGPCPVDPAFGEDAGPLDATPASDTPRPVTYYHQDRPGLLVPFISADARMIVWYGVGAVGANMNYVVLQPGERNKEHLHRYSEDTIYIVDGHGTAEDVTNGRKLPFGPGDTVTIPPGVVHAIAADRGERVVSVGGPCPADLDMLRAVGVDVEALAAGLAAP